MTDTTHEFLEAVEHALDAKSKVTSAERSLASVEKDLQGLPTAVRSGVLKDLQDGGVRALENRGAEYKAAKHRFRAALLAMVLDVMYGGG